MKGEVVYYDFAFALKDAKILITPGAELFSYATDTLFYYVSGIFSPEAIHWIDLFFWYGACNIDS